jgi:hypothetical protein
MAFSQTQASQQKKKKKNLTLDFYSTLFKLDYLEKLFPNQSPARFENPGVKAQRLISKD